MKNFSRLLVVITFLLFSGTIFCQIKQVKPEKKEIKNVKLLKTNIKRPAFIIN